jgi:hypothetical protein
MLFFSIKVNSKDTDNLLLKHMPISDDTKSKIDDLLSNEFLDIIGGLDHLQSEEDKVYDILSLELVVRNGSPDIDVSVDNIVMNDLLTPVLKEIIDELISIILESCKNKN